LAVTKIFNLLSHQMHLNKIVFFSLILNGFFIAPFDLITFTLFYPYFVLDLRAGDFSDQLSQISLIQGWV
jgi:hypothetical protein